MTKSQRETYTEVLMILDNMDPNYKNKIPQRLIDFFEKNSLENYESEINVGIPLNEQKIKSRTLALLALLNINYWCETEEEKENLIMQYKENEKKYQKNKSTYLNKSFEKDNNISSETEKTLGKENSIVEYKEESIFEKIINKIKGIFSKNK